MDLIRLNRLAIHYGSFCAFRAEEVALPMGAVGLLGPNGAGKSTLLKVLLGLLQPSSGAGEVLGLDLRRQSLAIRGRVGYMPENDSFVPGLTAVQFVTLAGELAGMPRRQALRRAHETLYYVGLEEARYRRIEEYSTGMKQRFKLAQALVHDPELLILDEPTSSLDPASRRSMLQLIRSLQRDFGKSILLSTHLLDEVDQLCDSVLILNRGEVAANGRIQDLRVHWRNRYRLDLDGEKARYVQSLEAAGAQVLPAERGGGEADGGLVVEVPENWPNRRFFEILAALDGSCGNGAPVLRALRPDHERLDRLFQRLVSREAGEKDAPR
ncbi:MAG: ABC transporter ATP-binding protein [Planctomycetes bacterium]|nr:ABC transporter ATP-binding protein [Planctomycetota bacterium]